MPTVKTHTRTIMKWLAWLIYGLVLVILLCICWSLVAGDW